MRTTASLRGPVAWREALRIGVACAVLAAVQACAPPERKPASAPCRPPVEPVNWNGLHDDAASTRLKILFDAHQASRSTDQVTLAQVLAEDEARRTEVMAMLKGGALGMPRDFFYAGTLFLYSTCADHHKLAMDLARRAWERGIAEAWSLYGQAAVRLLQSQGVKPEYQSNSLHKWLDLDPINRKYNKVEEGVFRIPLKLPLSLEAERESLEQAVLEAQRLAHGGMKSAGGGRTTPESMFDRAAIFDDEAVFAKVLEQLQAGMAGASYDRPCAMMTERTLAALSPTLAARRDPKMAGGENFVKLLTQAIEQGR